MAAGAMIQPTQVSKATQLERHAAERLSDNPTARFAYWLTPQSWRHLATTRGFERCDMPSAFLLLEKNRHDAVAVAHPAACIVVQGDAALAYLIGEMRCCCAQLRSF